MTYIPRTDPRVIAALERIRALRELSRQQGIRTTRSQNDLLSSLPDEVLVAVAFELKQDERTNRHDCSTSSAK